MATTPGQSLSPGRTAAFIVPRVRKRSSFLVTASCVIHGGIPWLALVTPWIKTFFSESIFVTFANFYAGSWTSGKGTNHLSPQYFVLSLSVSLKYGNDLSSIAVEGNFTRIRSYWKFSFLLISNLIRI